MKQTYMKKVFLVSILGLMVVFFIGIATPTKAVTISQLLPEFTARPGETIEQVIQLYDDSLQGVTVYPIVYNFTTDPNKEGAILVLTEPKDLKPNREWLKFGEVVAVDDEEATVDEDVDEDVDDVTEIPTALPVSIELPADGTLVDFPYRIEVPQGAEPGTHLISLVFQLKPQAAEGDDGSVVLIGANVATNIFLKVLGATIDDIELDFSSGIYANDDTNLSAAERKSFFEANNFFFKPPVDFLLTINNTGNTHQKPDGNVKIVNDLFGSAPEKLLVNPENRIILPGTERTFSVPSFGQGFMFGKFRAKLTMLYGNPLKPVEQEIVFWIIPVIEIAIVLGVLLLIIITWIIIHKMRKKGKEKTTIEREEKMRQQILAELKPETIGGSSDTKGKKSVGKKKSVKGKSQKKKK